MEWLSLAKLPQILRLFLKPCGKFGNAHIRRAKMNGAFQELQGRASEKVLLLLMRHSGDAIGFSGFIRHRLFPRFEFLIA
jgi:hypothetical protein